MGMFTKLVRWHRKKEADFNHHRNDDYATQKLHSQSTFKAWPLCKASKSNLLQANNLNNNNNNDRISKIKVMLVTIP